MRICDLVSAPFRKISQLRLVLCPIYKALLSKSYLHVLSTTVPSFKGPSPRGFFIATCRVTSTGWRPQHYHHHKWAHALEKKWDRREWDFQRQHVRPRRSLGLKALDSLNKTSCSGKWVQMKNTYKFYSMAHLPSAETWQVCVHSFTCTSWCKKKKKGLSSRSVGYWAKPDLFLELSHFILSNSDMMRCYLYRFNVLRFPYYPRYP